ncbi:DUF3015 family protein [Alkalimonas amylolytica]|uniref:DUF3015 domain-containing protein n=1 Tax=Alkalimonas amylolytica TaxID=152573 RepID=A0A1H4DAI6_ALKAM|nr:DUF3015 family protein [Alkalimonas amylolytica]SEA69677.1 Protein of unknown function [Alkalimonas amylolytica]
MKKTFFAVALVTAAVSTAPTVQADSSINPWKHCGIGAMIFDDNGAAAAISNIIWDLGTTAISSKISSEESCKGQRVAAAQFLQDTIAQVEEETVIGDGVHLTTVLNLMGCEAAAHPGLIGDMRSNLDLNTEAKAESYFLQLEATIQQNYAAQCTII